MKTKNIKIISVDAANKSLAVACLEYHDCSLIFAELLLELINCKNMAPQLDKMSKALDNITINLLTVVDLIPGKKISETNLVERTCSLKKFLFKITSEMTSTKWLTADVHLVIEYQMGPNRKSGDIQSQIMYHFSQYLPQNNIHVIGPSLKNKLKFQKDPLSFHNFYIEKYQTLYAANKAHTRYLFLSWLKNNKQSSKLQNIKKKNYSDISDAFCQAIAWCELFQARMS